MNKQTKTKAIVLKRTNYGEADRILQIITPLGKMSVLARGVRKEKSKLAGGIELLAVSDIVVAEGKGDIGSLISSRLDRFYSNILKDYDRLEFANLVLKNISKYSENVDESVWFEITREIFEALNDLKIQLQIIKSWFYLKISAYQGHELSLIYDTEGSRLSHDGRYFYDVKNRGLSIKPNGPVTSEHIKILRILNNRPINTILNVGGINNYIEEVYKTAREHAAVYEK